MTITCRFCDNERTPKGECPHCGAPLLPDDYEACGECGFDHEYETQEANAWHIEALRLASQGETMTVALQEIISKMKPGDKKVLLSLPDKGSRFICGGDYDFAINLLDFGLATCEGGLDGWSAYFTRTDMGDMVVVELLNKAAP